MNEVVPLRHLCNVHLRNPLVLSGFIVRSQAVHRNIRMAHDSLSCSSRCDQKPSYCSLSKNPDFQLTTCPITSILIRSFLLFATLSRSLFFFS
mmetsp:Transcript_1611/g.5551  ORF Transcript_1611/g.5551 Transcript_1611/m.5551 type:complete len:93 (-) Transcript_1611:1941-2219(-)